METSLSLTTAEKPKVEGRGNFSLSRVVVLSGDDLPAYGRTATTIRALESMKVKVEHIRLVDASDLLVNDPQGIHKYAVLVNKVKDRVGKIDGLIVSDLDAVLTDSAASFMREQGIWSIVIDDSGESGVKRIGRLLKNFDLVAVSAPYVVQQFEDDENLLFLPPFVDNSFIRLLESVDVIDDGIRVRLNPQTEESMLPGAEQDLSLRPLEWKFYSSMSIQELAFALRTRLAFVSFARTRSNPILPHLFPYVIAASDFTFVPRLPLPHYSALVGNAAVQVNGAGEIPAKLSDLVSSDTVQDVFSEGKRKAIYERMNAEFMLEYMIQRLSSIIKPGERRDVPSTVAGHVHKAPLTIDFSSVGSNLGASCLVEIKFSSEAPASGVRVAIAGSKSDFIEAPLMDDGLVWRVMTKTHAIMQNLKLRVETSGSTTTEVAISFVPEKLMVVGQSANVAVVDCKRRS